MAEEITWTNGTFFDTTADIFSSNSTILTTSLTPTVVTEVVGSNKWLYVTIFVIVAIIVFIVFLLMVVMIYVVCCQKKARDGTKSKFLNLKKKGKPKDRTEADSALKKQMEDSVPGSAEGLPKMESGVFSVASDQDYSKPIPYSPTNPSETSLDDRPTDLKV